MKRVTGLGGLFFKAKDPERHVRLVRETPRHRGQARRQAPCFTGAMPTDPEKTGMTVWSIFPQTTKYFDPSSAPS